MKHGMCIAWIAIRELFYERVFYLLFMFAVLALGLSFLLGQLTYTEQSKLTLDFMLAGIQLSMVLFSIFMGIALFQKELTTGSIAMVLSKPVSRSSFVLGKYFGQIAVQAFVMLAMGLITIFAVSRFHQMSELPILQAVLLTFFEICTLSAVTYFFAVNCGPVTAAVGTVTFFLVGHFADVAPKRDPTQLALWNAIKSVIPNLEIFNMKALASYGLTLSWKEVGIAGGYAGVCVAMYLCLAILLFQRKDILT